MLKVTNNNVTLITSIPENQSKGLLYNNIDTIDYVQGIGNGPINPLHPCPKPNTFST